VNEGRAGEADTGVDASLQFRSLVQQSSDMVSIYDDQGRYTFANPAHGDVLGYHPDELVGRLPLDFIHPDEAESVAIEFAAQLAGERPPAPVEMRFHCRDGSYRVLEAVAVDLTSEPAVGGVFVIARDVSDRKRAEAVVAEQTAILERIARGADLSDTLVALCEVLERWIPGGVATVLMGEGEPRVMRVLAAPSAPAVVVDALDGTEVPKLVRDELPFGIVVAPTGTENPGSAYDQMFLEAGLACWWAAPMFASDGVDMLGGIGVLLPEMREPHPVQEQILIAAGSLAAIAVERDTAQARLRHQASHDALTGLPNRDRLVQRLREITEGGGARGHAAVFFLDLDRFKVFNDSVGHDAGDRILVELGQRLRGALRDGDAVARFGGDEFVVVCDGLGDASEVIAVAQRLLRVVARPFVVDDAEFVVSASVGVARIDGRPPEELLRDADAAMYHAKERGRARVEVFDDDLRARVVSRLQIERELQRAVEVGEFTVHYQPMIALETQRLAGFEALVRWEHPTEGLFTPAAFLDVAEETGIIARIGAFARSEACRQWSRWRAEHPEWGHFVIGMNLAAAELRDSALPTHVAQLLAETGADPSYLVFETSERVLADDTEAARAVLTELRSLGVMLALDDFGTGSSPLLHLRHFPIDSVKLDGALVAGLGVNRDDDVIVESVIALAHRLGLFVVAEGVERDDQIDRLRRMGCLLAQGHAFASAMAVEDVERWVAARPTVWSVLDRYTEA
jgi:diguanylate cyclase (GGDEF)-like protein/PAS domain S-box-containing protein